MEALNRLSEQNANTVIWLAASYSLLQQGEEAARVASQVLELQPDFTLSTTPIISMLATEADRDHLREALSNLGLPE